MNYKWIIIWCFFSSAQGNLSFSLFLKKFLLFFNRFLSHHFFCRGSAVAKIIGNNVKKLQKCASTVKMWVFEETVNGRKLTDIINNDHENVKYLPGHKLPENVVRFGGKSIGIDKKIHSDFYTTPYGKTRMNLLANPIHLVHSES